MTDPNSLLSVFRQALARRLQPSPDPGEAWCTDCPLDPDPGEAWCTDCPLDPDGRTVIISADGAIDHARTHPPGSATRIDVTYPVTRRKETG